MDDLEFSVVANNLTKRFLTANGSEQTAIDNLSFSIKPGILTGLVGPDGAGKTTVMRLMAGLLLPDSGELTVLNYNPVNSSQKIQSLISYMPQKFGLYEDLSVIENLSLYANLHQVPEHLRQQRFEKMLAMTDLTAFTQRPAGKLSGGMKQKLGLACTLVRSPKLLLLDEPTVGVDPLSRRELWQIVYPLVREEGLSVVFSSTYMEEAEPCDNIIVLHQGVKLAEGSSRQLKDKVRGLTYQFKIPSGKLPRNLQSELLNHPDFIVDAIPVSNQIHCVRNPEKSEHAFFQNYSNFNLRPRPETLTDFFILALKENSSAEKVHALPVDLNAASEINNENKPLIKVEQLLRRFGDFIAVQNISFSVKRGEIFGLLGPNGAGKTTTFRMLCGLLPASQGILEVAGVNLRHARAKARQNIGYVSQKYSLYGSLTDKENLAFFGQVYGLTGAKLEQRITELVTAFQLPLDVISNQLSAGYKQRLAMATALLHQPHILFLDEPTSGIDPLARREFWRTITELSDQGVTIIITTHFMEEAEFCDRIAIQDSGKLLALGSPKEIRLQAKQSDETSMNDTFIHIVEHNRVQPISTRKASTT